MRKLLFFLLLQCCSLAAFAYETVDDDGHLIRVSKPAKHIVSLSPDLTEILFAIGAGKAISGVIKGCDYPKEAKALPIVGNYLGLDLERILALKPDLIVVWADNFARQLTIIKKLNVPIYVARPKQLTDVAKTMEHLGILTDHVANAQHAAQNFSATLAKLQARYQGLRAVKVFYQIGNFSFMTINKNSWINQAITLCGGQNPFADAAFSAPEMTAEAIVMANPEVVITDSNASDFKQKWRALKAVSASKYDLLFAIDADLMDRAGPRLALGVQALCARIDAARKVIKGD